MKLASKKLCLVLASSALVLAACTKKPARPDPTSTVMGPQTGGPSIQAPIDMNPPAPGTDLQTRDPNIKEDENSIRGLLQPVYFDFDRSDVKQSERPKLQAAKDYLDQHPGTRILLEGHCDWRGTAEYNLSLGDRRANAAKKYLLSLGVPADRTESNSKGSLEASKNADDATMAKDRRAEIVILKAKPAGAMTPL
ncbi:MAG TPA: OmpA family protein [Opitutaceae bacterium]|nr:OmpA family protein [Opitutaceae bacterium]